MLKNIVILGGGHAGAQAAESLRSEGFDGTVTLVSAEPHLPYHRPPLSKAHLKEPGDPPYIRPEAFYREREIETRLGCTATAIDRPGMSVVLANGERIPYDGMVYAAGSRLRRLNMAGADLGGVHYLKTLDDSSELAADLRGDAHVAVVGGGFIGLEVAATARARGCAVTVFEVAPRLMARAVSGEISNYFRSMHAASGIDIHFGTGVTAIEGVAGRAVAVMTTVGERIAVDVVVIGVGVEANSELARDAGLKVDHGVVVTEQLCTTDPRIVAAGDCVTFRQVNSGHYGRLESVQNANDQARCSVRALLGRPETYRETPWFWSDQGPDKLQMAGIQHDADQEVLRGDPASGKFAVFHFADERLVAVEAVNRPGDYMVGRRLIAARRELVPQDFADESVDLKDILRTAGRVTG